jgi:uncharacterized protein YbbC (DUF1343 family)
MLYPGIGLIETTNVSVGRGTDTPFEVVGAPWIDARRLASHLNRAILPGVRFVPMRFTPTASRYANELCNGVNVIITDRFRFRPVSTGLQLMCSLKATHNERWDRTDLNSLLSSRKTIAAIESGSSVSEIEPLWAEDLAHFLNRRRRFLRYE